jgi:Zn-dependent protease
MGPGFKIGRLFGIDIFIQTSWIVIVALVTYSLAVSWFPVEGWSTGTTWAVAFGAALLLFFSVLVHELAHSLVARAQGIPVRSITLFLLGGVSTIESESTSPGNEALMAGAGPASSLVIGAACFELSRVMQTPSIAHALLFYLGYVNIFLAIFNMLPGFPLDGSRVLRSVIWALTHDPVKATRWAAGTGSVVGALMIGAGALVALRANDPFGGLWLAFLGFIVLQSSRAASQQSRAESRLAGVPVRDLMSPPATWIPGDITLRKAANDYFGALNAHCLPVQDDRGTLEGLICVSDLQRTDPQSWGVEQVQDVMTTVDRLQTVDPDEPAGQVFHRLATTDVSQLAVVEGGYLVGLVDQASVARYLRAGGRIDTRVTPNGAAP